MGSSLIRWIIAGVLLAIFVALIVTEELGATSSEAPVLLDGTVPTGPATMADPSALPVQFPPQKSPEEDRERKPELEAACTPITSRLQAQYGERWLTELGDKLWATRSDEEVTAICKELAGLGEAEQLTRLTQLTGLQPPR